MLAGGRVGRLGLLDGDGRPRVLPVTYAMVDGVVWSAIDHKPKRRAGGELARVRWLRKRPQVTLTVDHYDEDWSELAWVQVLGSVTIEAVDGHGAVLEALADKYPQYRDRPPGGPLLRLAVERIVSWRASQSRDRRRP
jgi:PPOX class probable F420-dependent enzyme